MLISSELRIQAPSGSKPILLREANIVEEGPKDVVTVAIVILIDGGIV